MIPLTVCTPDVPVDVNAKTDRHRQPISQFANEGNEACEEESALPSWWNDRTHSTCIIYYIYTEDARLA
jgi:hypothetical protein